MTLWMEVFVNIRLATKRLSLSIVLISLVSANLLTLAACGVLEVGIERTPTPAGTPIPTFTSTPTWTPTFTPIPLPVRTVTPVPTPLPAVEVISSPIPGPTTLRVAFVKESNVWLWTGVGDGKVTALTSMGRIDDLRISDDGEIVAFVRAGELWMVSTDGASERPLVSAADFKAMEPRVPFDQPVVLHRFDWIPGTHVLAFSTRLDAEIGLILNDDLRLVDADTSKWSILLAPGEGGEFYPSPDGRQIAVATAGTIDLVDVDGGNRREALTYTPPALRSEAQYYARPAWAADASSLRVVVPPPDPYAQPSQPSSVWYLYTDGTPARLLKDIAAAPGSTYAFSPDLRYVAYQGRTEGALRGREGNLLVTDLATNGTVVYSPKAGQTVEWAPDSTRFAFLVHRDPRPPQAQIGQLGHEPVPVYGDADAVVVDLRWVDVNRYLFLVNGELGWEIVLGEMGGISTVLATTTLGPPAYDHNQAAGTPGEWGRASASPSPPSPTPTPDTLLPCPASGIPTSGELLDTSTWQVFRDQSRGFRFRYPDGWRLEIFDSGMGVGPEEMGEDVLWGIRFFDAASTTVSQVVDNIGHQFKSSRTETRECIYFNEIVALKVTVTTSQVEGWYAESIIFEHRGTIFQISNGARRDDRFETFYNSFHLR